MYELIAGIVYSVNVTVGNTSAKGGILIDATFDVTMISTFTSLKQITVNIPAGGQAKLNFPLPLPADISGAGKITVDALAPDGLKVGSGSEDITVLVPVGDLFGRVYDMVTNAPIQGAAVTIGGQTAFTNSDGEYGIPAIPIGSHDASFSKAGYETTYYLENLVIKEGINTINVGLMPSPTASANVFGKVIDRYDGLALPGVKVTLTGYRAVGDPPTTVQVYHETETDNLGVYSFANVLNISYTASFILESYGTKAVNVDLLYEDKEVNVELEWTGTGLRLYHSPGGTYTGFSIWDAAVTNLDGTTVPRHSAPGALVEPHMPIDFEITSLKFLLTIMEMPYYPEPGPYWFGPYLVEIPEPGTYIWNAASKTIDGGSALDLPHSDNETDIIATILKWDSDAYGTTWGPTLLIEETRPVEGKVDVGSMYVGQNLRIMPGYATGYPYDSLGNPLIPIGTRITCKLKMQWGVYSFLWKIWDMHEPREYPDSAYEFTGGVVPGAIRDQQFYDAEFGMYYTKKVQDFSWSVGGGTPPFKAAVTTGSMYGGHSPIWQGIGPASGSYYLLYDDLQYGYVSPGPIYANPNPSKVWRKETWVFENWVRV